MGSMAELLVRSIPHKQGRRGEGHHSMRNRRKQGLFCFFLLFFCFLFSCLPARDEGEAERGERVSVEELMRS